MDIPRLQEILDGIDRAISECDKTAPRARSEAERKILTAGASDLRKLRGRVEKEVPDSLNQLKAHLEELHARAERVSAEAQAELARVSELDAQAQAAEIARNTKPIIPEPEPVILPIDPQLGSKLRKDLLDTFFPHQAPPPPPREGKDIWQDWQ